LDDHQIAIEVGSLRVNILIIIAGDDHHPIRSRQHGCAVFIDELYPVMNCPLALLGTAKAIGWIYAVNARRSNGRRKHKVGGIYT
jgi:hypothetical protein